MQLTSYLANSYPETLTNPYMVVALPSAPQSKLPTNLPIYMYPQCSPEELHLYQCRRHLQLVLPSHYTPVGHTAALVLPSLRHHWERLLLVYLKTTTKHGSQSGTQVKSVRNIDQG